MSEPAGRQVRVGIRWRTGASEEVMVTRPVPAPVARRTPRAAVDLVRQYRERPDAELVTELNAAGYVTGTGRPFNLAAVCV